jgi:SAM-dependent methyltransferase
MECEQSGGTGLGRRESDRMAVAVSDSGTGMLTNRQGYEVGVGTYRAKANTADPEHDKASMVQESVARLRFATTHVSMKGKAVLDYGCGTGLALQWLRLHDVPERAVGFDVSEGSIDFAKSHYPGIEFRVVDIEAPSQEFCQQFDVVLFFEVLEHLKHPEHALSFISGHYLKADGLMIVSTPNRMVFSAGMEPSPINRTHIHEMDLAEFQRTLVQYFGHVEIRGMRFTDPARRIAHAKMVQHACAGYRLFGEAWWNPWVRRFYHYLWCGEVFNLILRGRHHRWLATDFEFIENLKQIEDSAIWLFAIARKQ